MAVDELGAATEIAERFLDNIETVVHGKREQIKLVVAALMCGGHALLEDVPGTAKTVLARAIAGWIAGNIMRGGGFGLLGNIVVGIVGALVGGWVFGLMGIAAGGTLGSLTIPHLDLWHNPTSPSWWEPLECERLPVATEDPLGLQVRQFCRVIRGTEPPLVSGRDGLETLKVIAAVKEAAASGQTVQLA